MVEPNEEVLLHPIRKKTIYRSFTSSTTKDSNKKQGYAVEIEMVPFYPIEVDPSMLDNPWNCDSGYLALPLDVYTSYF